MPQSVKITIDGKEIEVPAGMNLIEASKLTGASIPHYCYHPKLSVAGNCRICLVEIEKQPKLNIACNTKVAEGMVVRTDSPKVLEGRQSVMEFILVNHPIDCPVCDQAGECRLQEYYMQHDLKPSRMTEEKVHKEKATPLGPGVMLDMERCILCSRCIRFCQEVAHEDELCFSQRGNHTELTTYPGKKLENAYSLNTVDICPVGALTSRDFRFKQRVWLLKEQDSVCNGCATGCNIRAQYNGGVIYRLLPRESEAVNQVWMCDEGRFTYKPVNQENRLRRPRMRQDGRAQDLRAEKALAELKRALAGVPGRAILGIGSAQFTNESNYTLMRFLKDVLGVNEFAYHAKEVPNPSQDDFLISPDKNPNRAGVEALGMIPFATEATDLLRAREPVAGGLGGADAVAPRLIDRRYQVFFVLGDLPFSRLQKIAFEKNSKFVIFGTHDVPEIEYADFLFPVATWAEEDGTITNRQKRVQRIRPTFPPPGEARPVWEWVVALAKVWGSDKFHYEQFAHVLADLAESVPAFKGMNEEIVGKGGAVLA